MQNNVTDHIPIEQGLRPSLSFIIEIRLKGHRPYSNRTRIKTEKLPTFAVNKRMSHRPYSNRTRIKTFKCYDFDDFATEVTDHIPIEQGLRHCNFFFFRIIAFCHRPYSNRTRIKTGYPVSII